MMKPNPEHATFKRMLKALRKKGITPTVWNGKEAVPLKDYIKAWNKKKARRKKK